MWTFKCDGPCSREVTYNVPFDLGKCCKCDGMLQLVGPPIPPEELLTAEAHDRACADEREGKPKDPSNPWSKYR
jgi:hypothetical protein